MSYELANSKQWQLTIETYIAQHVMGDNKCLYVF